jgi:nucleoside-diphosphate-sugar epimerase
MELGARVRAADDLSSGSLQHLKGHRSNSRFEFMKGDLRDSAIARKAVAGREIVFHLAADHGGRGYVDTFQALPAVNLTLDGLVFWEAHKAGAEKIIFASSGCVYPNHLQGDPSQELYLTEDLVRPPYDSDNMYGWAKLMGELTLQAYHKEFGMKTASCRYFTVYGPRGKENHAVIAMIARAFIGQNPFDVWGTGEQIRNWTFVQDIVLGTLLAAEKIDDGTAVNLGTMERIRVRDAVNMVLEFTGHRAKIRTLPDMPTGPLNRVAHNGLARKLLGWTPQVPFREGLRRTIEWYFKNKDRNTVRSIIEGGGLIQRKVSRKS